MEPGADPTVAGLLAERSQALVGRRRELTMLGRLLTDDGPLIAYVHGVAGVGKTTLTRAFAARARQDGALVVLVGGGDVEPTERGFLSAVGERIHATGPGETLAALRRLRGRVLVVVDAAERLGLLDDWLRRELVPALPRHVRVLLAGRERPNRLWTATYGDLLLRVPLGGLAGPDADELLARLQVPPAAAAEIRRVARGHPLSLQLAASAVAAAPAAPLADVAASALIAELTELYLGNLPAPTRQALDAAALVRRPTRSALRAMLPGRDADDLFDRLRELPFAELGPDGLVVHETVRDAVDAGLRAADPERRRDLRRAAYRHLRGELRAAGAADLWRSTADMLFLVDNPLVRDGFFPPAQEAHAVEAATPADHDAIRAVMAAHDPPAAAGLLDAWLAAAPQAFRVARGRDGDVAGLIAICERQDVPARLVDRDPVARTWREDARRDPVGPDDRVLYTRCLLSRDAGEAPSDVQAALWVDAKRAYMELRPTLRRMYVSFTAPEVYLPMLEPLGFRRVREGVTELGGRSYHALRLDFGPRSVDGWLARLVAGELDADDELIVDPGRRELMVRGHRVELTALELGLVRYLMERDGRPVGRDELLRHVWADEWQGGSNVVDVAVSGLRRKLGAHASLIETVRGVGYRLRPDAGPASDGRARAGVRP